MATSLSGIYFLLHASARLTEARYGKQTGSVTRMALSSGYTGTKCTVLLILQMQYIFQLMIFYRASCFTPRLHLPEGLCINWVFSSAMTGLFMFRTHKIIRQQIHFFPSRITDQHL